MEEVGIQRLRADLRMLSGTLPTLQTAPKRS